MKNLFNELSSSSGFFREKRFIFDAETAPKKPASTEVTSEVRFDQASIEKGVADANKSTKGAGKLKPKEFTQDTAAAANKNNPIAGLDTSVKSEDLKTPNRGKKSKESMSGGISVGPKPKTPTVNFENMFKS